MHKVLLECKSGCSYYILVVAENIPLLFHHSKDAFNDITESSMGKVEELTIIIRPKKQQNYNVITREMKTIATLLNDNRHYDKGQ